MPDTRTMYIEFREPANPEAVLTDLLAKGIWEYGTGQWDCRDRCDGRAPDEDRHLAWEKLTDSRKNAFLKRLADFLERIRAEEMDARVLMGRAPELDGVELTPHWK